ncbi:MAG: histidine phosphatase family protein [Roseibium sp.]|nr:histidine phosphatase family protein [Roseibium sp.]
MSPAAVADQSPWDAVSDGDIVLFRHALAPGTGDPNDFRLGDCTTQRNLNDAGREDARRIGAAFVKVEIGVGRVLTSQWCRCRETADLAFPGRAEDAPVFNSFFRDRSRGPQQTEDARRLLLDWTGPGVLVVVTHQVNITALTDIFPTSGEGIHLRKAGGALEIIGRFPVPEDVNPS